MGKNNKERVQLVISHIEGCSGNFLGRLAVGYRKYAHNVFRVDQDLNDQVLAINGRESWTHEIENRLMSHHVVVTHNFDRVLISQTFPNAKIIAVYPYTHLGNVLYNICWKKLTVTLTNAVDNHYLHIREWYEKIQHWRPEYICNDWWDLTDIEKIQCLLDAPITQSQQQFFDTYWKNQLCLKLDFPKESCTITELIQKWKLHDRFDPWLTALVIFVYELTNGWNESDRLWTIDDADKFAGWQDVIDIGEKYQPQGKTIC